MKAAVCRSYKEPLTIEDIRLAEPTADQIEVEMKAVAVCHSDLSWTDGIWGGDLPAVFGHEAAGVVTKVGKQVRGFSIGDHVCVTLVRSCGWCPACNTGHRSECDKPWDQSFTPLSGTDGAPIIRSMNTGAFAERVVVCPSQCVRIPRDMPFASASLLSCGVITGVGAVINTAGVAPGATVAVIGAGGVGLNAIQGAAIAGASTILALDLLEAKLADARDFGATHGLLASDNDVLSKALALTTNGRGFDYVFVTVGAPKAFEETPRFLARGGAMVVVGMPPADAVLGYSPLLLADRSIRFLGSSMGQTNVGRDIPWLTSLYQQGRLKLDELVSATYRLEEINEAFEATRAGRIRRNVILFD